MDEPQLLPLASTLLALLRLAIDRVRAVFRRRVIDPLLDPDTRISKARFLRMMETLFASEARVRREIYETALKMLGASQPRLPLRTFRLPRPSGPAEIGRRFAAHARMSQHAEWSGWRLARRLRKMLRAGRDPLRPGALRQSHERLRLQTPASRWRQKVDGLASPTHVGEVNRARSVRDGGGLRSRAPPFFLTFPIAA
jgi:hypothetical protein